MRKLVKSLLFISLLLSFTATVSAQIQVPSPQENTWVHDFANVISEEQEKAINETCDELNAKEYAQLNVVTVEFLDGNNVTDYGTTLFNEWGIGDAETNNGILILLSVGDRELGFMQGKGLETILPSSDLGKMANEVAVPLMSEDNYEDGLVAYANAISTHLNEYHNEEKVPSEPVSDEVLAQQYYDEFMASVKDTMVKFVLFVVAIVILSQVIILLTNKYGRNSRPSYVDSKTIYHGRPVERNTSSNTSSRTSRITTSRSTSRSSSTKSSSSSRSSSRSNGGGSTRGSGGSRKF